jgi:L-fuconolactonase
VRVDAHHHFWDPGRAEYAFLTDDRDAVRRAFGPWDLAPDLAAEGIGWTVLVQARPSEDETVELLAMAARVPFVAGVVGWVDLTAPDVPAALARLRALPGGQRLVGIRHQVEGEPDARWLLRDDVRRGLLAVGAAGLAYDLLVTTRELPAAVEVCRSLPGVRFVLDHLAKPPIAEGDLSTWGRGILELAELPNVHAKISGLVTEADWRAWSMDDLRHPVELAVDAFGSRRLMLGSDWPLCLLAGTYAEVVGSVREMLSELAPHEQDDILGGTATRVYRLRPPG